MATSKKFRASHKYAPVTARKARLVMNIVRGMPVNDALEALATSHRRAAPMIGKVIRSAVANAEQTQAVGADDLVISEARVDEGPLKQGRLRWRPGAMGRIKPIRKRTSHLEIGLDIVEDRPEKTGGTRRRRKARRESAAGVAETAASVAEAKVEEVVEETAAPETGTESGEKEQ